MRNNDLIDLVALTKEHIRDHNAKHWAGLRAFRAEINDCDTEFSRLREIDLSSEENLSRKLFYALINEDGEPIAHPGLLAINLSGHITHLEVRSSFYATYATLLGAATAIWSIEGKDAVANILLFGLFTFIALVAKWHLDKRVGVLKRLFNHLQFIAPNFTLNQDALKRRSLRTG